MIPTENARCLDLGVDAYLIARVAAIGGRLAMARTTSGKYAIKRVYRSIGNAGRDMEILCRDLIDTVMGNAREILPRPCLALGLD